MKKPVTPEEAMQMAIEEGKKGAGFVSPNPLVGCVILDKDHQLLALGHHARLGGAHAEAHALSQISDKSRLQGAHVFVTLEPCAHQGRTPSCAKALATLPLASVTYGLIDPDTRVQGKGIEILKAAGIRTTPFGYMQNELRELCEIFLCNKQKSRPFVALKMATTLDGKVAMEDGTSQWITSEDSRSHVHSLRGCYDAVVIGEGTWRRDNPRLNSRDSRFASKKSRVVVLDSSGRVADQLKDSNLLKVRDAQDVIVVTPVKPLADFGLTVVQQPLLPNGQFDLTKVLSLLYDLGVYSLFVEGGALTYGSFLKNGLVDRMYLYLAPKVLGSGLSWPNGYVSATLNSAVRLDAMRVASIGPDVFITGQVSLTQSNL